MVATGGEVGGGEDRFDVGTMARIVRADVAPDGQANIVVVGTERFRVNRWMDDAPYPLASVVELEDTDSTSPDVVSSYVRRVRRMLAQRAELNLAAPPATIELAEDPTMALWQACALLPTEAHDDLALLASPSVASRIELLDRLLGAIETKNSRLLGGEVD